VSASSLTHLNNTAFDVAIIGGGINGACLYHSLTTAGYRVLLADRGDFGAATSQSSTMMIWGGLLYMKDWELRTVASLSASRDRLIRDDPRQIQPRTVRFVPVPGGRSTVFVHAALHAYWLLGLARRHRPQYVRDFPERAMLNHGGVPGALTYEEASLDSDARFVLSWILKSTSDNSIARNYCEVVGATYDRSASVWRLDLEDTLTAASCRVQARLVINAAGGWTDDVNAAAGVESPYRHVLSRGVSIAVDRDPRHTTHLVFESGVGGNAMTFVPWGPVSLWASTDTVHGSMDEARRPEAGDITSLIAQLNQHLATPVTPADIVSIRCGVRPLAVPRHSPVDEHSPSLSRHHRIHVTKDRPWISVYGGKLSGCTTLARTVATRVDGLIGSLVVPAPVAPPAPVPIAPTTNVPMLDTPVTTPEWAVAHEQCRTLDDYLRRRTNIAQWIRRGGLGQNDEHLTQIQHIATAIHGGDAPAATRDLDRYRTRVNQEWRLLEGVSL
jgi:glycerol-3-phosphate dehydrogenase